MGDGSAKVCQGNKTNLCSDHFWVLVRVVLHIFRWEDDHCWDGECVGCDQTLDIFGNLEHDSTQSQQCYTTARVAMPRQTAALLCTWQALCVHSITCAECLCVHQRCMPGTGH